MNSKIAQSRHTRSFLMIAAFIFPAITAYSQISTKQLPKISNDIHCKTPHSNTIDASDPCASTKLEVHVAPITKKGIFYSCVAYFNYRSLTIHHGKNDGTVLTWTIGEVEPLLTGSGQPEAVFTGPGIVFTDDVGADAPKNNDRYSVTTLSQGKVSNSVSVTVSGDVIKPKNGKKQEDYGHLPIVQYRANKLDGWTECGRIDPTISNNPS